MKDTPIQAWHFVGATLRDGSPVPADGEPLVHTGPVRMCEAGLHASRRLIDALTYAPGDTICRVSCQGIKHEDPDKLVCRERTILWRLDGEDLLRTFARLCALDVIHLWDAPPDVHRYLETGDAALRDAAWDAAWDAARAAARAVAWDAARAATWAAAGAKQSEQLESLVLSARAAEEG